MERARKPRESIWVPVIRSLWHFWGSSRPPRACREVLGMPGCEAAGLRGQACILQGKNPKLQAKPAHLVRFRGKLSAHMLPCQPRVRGQGE